MTASSSSVSDSISVCFLLLFFSHHSSVNDVVVVVVVVVVVDDDSSHSSELLRTFLVLAEFIFIPNGLNPAPRFYAPRRFVRFVNFESSENISLFFVIIVVGSIASTENVFKFMYSVYVFIVNNSITKFISFVRLAFVIPYSFSSSPKFSAVLGYEKCCLLTIPDRSSLASRAPPSLSFSSSKRSIGPATKTSSRRRRRRPQTLRMRSSRVYGALRRHHHHCLRSSRGTEIPTLPLFLLLLRRLNRFSRRRRRVVVVFLLLSLDSLDRSSSSSSNGCSISFCHTQWGISITHNNQKCKVVF